MARTPTEEDARAAFASQRVLEERSMTKYNREAVRKMSDEDLAAEIDKVERELTEAQTAGDEVERDRLMNNAAPLYDEQALRNPSRA